MVFKADKFFDLSNTEHVRLFDGISNVWDILNHLKDYLETLSLGVIQSEISPQTNLHNPEKITIGQGCVIDPSCRIEGPCFIGHHCYVGHGAYIRPYTILGNHARVGHCSEIKHSILMPFSKAPHFNYVGDSILGHHVNLGAGVILANYKLDGSKITIKTPLKSIETQLMKFGAVVGDHSAIGCNSVLNPGTLIYKEFVCKPLSNLLGVFESSKKVNSL